MVPPPNNTGDEFPDFDNMTPEEQMAWLESLAKRQGANEAEFTTDADVEIAEVPEDTVIDEPGYVPFSVGDKPDAKQEVEQAPEPVSIPSMTSPVEARADEIPDLLAELDAVDYEEESFMGEDANMSDPMQWLDSLSAQSESEMPETPSIADEDTSEFFAGVGEFDEVEDELLDELPIPPSVVEPMAEYASDSIEEIDDAQSDLFATLDELDDSLVEAVAELPENDDLLDEVVDDDFALVSDGAVDDDPLGGMDPMLWLESLAKRQGANAAEFTTSADLEVDQPPEDTVVDEPGYVPYDVVAGGPKKTVVEPEPSPDLVSELEESQELLDIYLEEEIEAEAAFVEEELLPNGVDPMEWLESLAKRQGARSEELTTDADLEIELPPEGTLVDEPGYVPFSAFGSAHDGAEQDDEEAEVEAVEMGEIEAVPAAPQMVALEHGVEVLTDEDEAEISDEAPVDESLAWLADLAGEPDEDVVNLFGAVEADTEEDEDVTRDLVVDAVAPDAEQPVDLLAGMSDEEIAYAQAHGQLTPHQELAWLKRQAQSLASARQGAEDDEYDEVTDLAPAEPGDLPPWLKDMQPVNEGESLPNDGEALFADAMLGTPEEVDLEGLFEEVVAEVEADIADLELEEDVELLWAEVAAEDSADTELDSELAALIDADLVPEKPDQLAEALDAEYDRRMAGDDREPEWYSEAVAQIADEDSYEEVATASISEEQPPETDFEPAAGMATADLTEAVPVAMPGWLEDETSDQVEPIDSEMPSWLTESADADVPVAAVNGMPDWLTEIPETEAAAGDLHWLDAAEPDEVRVPEQSTALGFTDVPQPEPLPTAVVPEVTRPEVRPLPEGELFSQYLQRLEADPNDHATRLSLARALRTGDELEASLDQYEALIEVAQLLDDIEADLNDLVEEHADEPRMRRLLGDTFMRQGRLQKALDAYRSALDRL